MAVDPWFESHKALTARRDVAVDFTGEESRTRQSDGEGADVNRIVKRFMAAGIDIVNAVTPVGLDGLPVEPRFADVSGGFDLANVQQRAIKAREFFEALPGDVRGRFANDAAKFFEWAVLPENNEEVLGEVIGKERFGKLKAAVAAARGEPFVAPERASGPAGGSAPVGAGDGPELPPKADWPRGKKPFVKDGKIGWEAD